MPEQIVLATRSQLPSSRNPLRLTTLGCLIPALLTPAFAAEQTVTLDTVNVEASAVSDEAATSRKVSTGSTKTATPLSNTPQSVSVVTAADIEEKGADSVAEALKRAVEDQNIQVIPCPDGQVRGRDSAVRVFNVQHIKGLEFEAVFFVGIDKLAESHPDLFEKYLYVGATRAATYFGMTCEKGFPEKLSSIREVFQETWV